MAETLTDPPPRLDPDAPAFPDLEGIDPAALPGEMRGASHRHMAASLTAPLKAGAADERLDVDAGGRVTLASAWFRPLLIAAPRLPVPPSETLRLRATRDPDGPAPESLPPLEWAAHTEAGTFLPLYLPPTAPGGRTTEDVLLELTLEREDTETGAITPLPPAEVAAALVVHATGGNTGRLLFALAAEKGRIRRQAREIAAARSLATARGGALDRHGADLGVERFRDRLVWNAERDELVTEPRPGGEPDAEYRRRLALYRPFYAGTKAGLTARLAAVHPDFGVIEEDSEFAVALHLIETGAGPHRARFLDYIRAVYLVYPANNPAANARHAARLLSSAQRDQMLALRQRLRDNWTLAGNPGFAPNLAAALDRAGRALRALGVPAEELSVTRAQDDAGGSRYELGLGCDVAAVPEASWNAARATLLARGWPETTDAETVRLLNRLADRGEEALPTGAEDPEGSWLLDACGMATRHPLGGGQVYVSHLPAYGLTVTGPSQVPLRMSVPLEAHWQAPGDAGGAHEALAAGLASTLAAWIDAGGAPWQVLDAATTDARWAEAAGAGEPPAEVVAGFAEADLPAARDAARVVAQLRALPSDRLATLALPASLTGPLLGGDAAERAEAGAALRQLLALLARRGISAALPLWTGAQEALLVTGVISLPLAGTNLAERSATAYRWYVAPLQPRPPAANTSAPDATSGAFVGSGTIGGVGTRTTFTGRANGLSLIMVLGYRRQPDRTDPYEYKVTLPEAATLTLDEYEFVMNLLAAGNPIGVEINTFDLRRGYVDLNGDSAAEPLSATVARTFRPFRRARSRGGPEDFAV